MLSSTTEGSDGGEKESSSTHPQPSYLKEEAPWIQVTRWGREEEKKNQGSLILNPPPPPTPGPPPQGQREISLAS